MDKTNIIIALAIFLPFIIVGAANANDMDYSQLNPTTKTVTNHNPKPASVTLSKTVAQPKLKERTLVDHVVRVSAVPLPATPIKGRVTIAALSFENHDDFWAHITQICFTNPGNGDLRSLKRLTMNANNPRFMPTEIGTRTLTNSGKNCVFLNLHVDAQSSVLLTFDAELSPVSNMDIGIEIKDASWIELEQFDRKGKNPHPLLTVEGLPLTTIFGVQAVTVTH